MIIRVHEYQRVRLSAKAVAGTIPDACVSALTGASEQHKRAHGEPLFDWVNPETIRFRHVVGVVQIGDLTIEILPKVHKGEMDGQLDRMYLLHMLRLSGTLPLTSDDVASLATQKGALVDIVLRLFAEETARQLKQGRVHRYQHVQNVRSSVRGRLLVKEHILSSASGAVTLPCRYTDFIADTALNRLLRTAARVGWRVAGDAHTRQHLQWVENQFDDVELLPAPYVTSIPELILDRSDRRFAKAAMLADRVLRALSPHLRGGKAEFVSLLFNMNELFEACITRMLKGVVRGTASFHSQGPGRYLLNRAGGSVFAMKPDVVVGWSTKEYSTTVIDTKWKLLVSEGPDRKWVSQSDAYQMYAYAHRYHAQRVVLLYPHWSGLDSEPGRQAVYVLPEDPSRTIEVWTVDVVGGVGLGKAC